MKSNLLLIVLTSIILFVDKTSFAAVCTDISHQVVLNNLKPEITLRGFSDLGIGENTVLSCTLVSGSVGREAAAQKCSNGLITLLMAGIEKNGQAVVQLLTLDQKVIFTGSCQR